MSKSNNIKALPGGGGVFNGVTDYIKLVIRLISDRRVNPLLKLLPIGTLLYFLIPDLVLGPIDDAVIIWIGTYLFIELAPPDVVAEHRAALKNVIPGAARDPMEDSEEVVEGEYRDVDIEDK